MKMAEYRKNLNLKDNDLERVLSGHVRNIPKQQSSVIRIFLSSTFTDMQEERNVLMREAFPLIRKFCISKGLDFQVVDMRWGVREEAQIDHKTTELCLNEVENCRNLSVGPCFVALLGDKYGNRPFPNKINKDEMDLLKRCARMEARNTKLLDEWFELDENAVPKEYVLKPITSIIPDYNNIDQPELMKAANDEWMAVCDIITSLLRHSANYAYATGKLNAEKKQKYFCSVTENEIIQGILKNVDDSDNNCLCFYRTLEDVNIDDPLARRFIDVEGGQVDVDAQSLLHDLKKLTLPSVFKSKNIFKYNIKWTKHGVDPSYVEHSEYLEQFCKDFAESVIGLIRRKLDSDERFKTNAMIAKSLYSEIVHHSTFCFKKIVSFYGREDLLREVQDKLQTIKPNPHFNQNSVEETKEKDGGISEDSTASASDEDDDETQGGDEKEKINETKYEHLKEVVIEKEHSDLPLDHSLQQELLYEHVNEYRKPLILHGISGSGKTALMAKICDMGEKWFGGKVVRIIRFLGTSPQSYNIKEALINVIQQIWFNYSVNPPSDLDLSADFSYLILYFEALLHRIDTSNRPLLIILDSIDQLNSDNYAHSLQWLPRFMPPTVFMIISFISDFKDCLEIAKSRIGEDDRFVEITNLPKDSAQIILDSWFKAVGRTVTPEQELYVIGWYKQCEQPLYLKLAFEQAVKWSSFTPREDWRIEKSVELSIERLFRNLEKTHGEILVSKALGYLTVARSGLADAELEDILSCDDDVLQDLYIHHLPPDPKVVRLPPLLWKRIRHSLGEYLVERRANGKDVVFWYHRTFQETAQKRYACEEKLRSLHSSIADYFEGKWANCIKPIEFFKKKIATFSDCSRQSPEQPIMLAEGIYNLRKLQELPFNLIHALRFDAFVRDICSNFKWLYSKIRATSIDEVMFDLDLALNVIREFQLMTVNMETDSLSASSLIEFGQGFIKSKTAVEDCEHEVRSLKNAFTLNRDVIRKDVNHLAIALLGQFVDVPPPSRCLAALKEQAAEWVERVRIPLMLPITQCLLAPGFNLLMNIDSTIFYMGDPKSNESKLVVSSDHRSLYVCERTHSKGDIIKIFHLEQLGNVVSLPQLTKTVKSIDLRGKDDQFINITAYDRRDEYDPIVSTLIIDQRTQDEILPPSGAKRLFYSKTGRCSIVPGIFNGKPENETQTFIGSLIDHENNANQSGIPISIKKADYFKIIRGVEFCFDDSYFIITSANAHGVWMIYKGKPRYQHLWKDVDDAENAFTGFENSKGDLAVLSQSQAITSNGYFLSSGFKYDDEGKLYVRNIKTGELVWILNGGDYDLNFVSLDPTERLVAVASSASFVTSNKVPKAVSIFNLESGKLHTTIKERTPCSLLEFFETSYIVTCKLYNGHVLQFWYIGDVNDPCPDPQVMFEITSHDGTVIFFNALEDKGLIITASLDNTIKLWDYKKILTEIRNKVEDYMQEDRRAEIKLQKMEMLQRPLKFQEGAMDVCGVAINGLNGTAVVVTLDQLIICYNLNDGTERYFVKLDYRVNSLAITKDGKYIITAGEKSCVYDANSGKLRHILEECKNVNYVVESNGIAIISKGGMEGIGHIYSVEDGKYIRKQDTLYGFNFAAITSDGKYGGTTIFDFPMIFPTENEDNSGFQMPDTMMASCSCLKFSPDDKMLISASTDGTVRVLECPSSKYRFQMRHNSSVTNIAFAEKEKHILTTSFRNILVWCSKTGSLIYALKRHTNFIHKIFFSCSGRFLITCSIDKRIILWDYERKCSIADFHAHGAVKHMDVDPNLDYIIYTPTNISYMALIKPNNMLKNIIKCGESNAIPTPVQQAQAVALAFSSSSVALKTSKACCIL
ncbi:DgyrCDS5351 [Dimorphilus gyrociliatus]|uniref:DgyrCDS5351 n=1 Tax=Dimorphilus gyrociliatus TaxID=2664684 RepID=A0A7I8VJM0_9ANNE|nr:DgyrCDS5351 [Dimorphilus gyrociliatus]